MQKTVPNYRIYGEFDADFSLNPVHIDDVKNSTEENNWIIAPHRHDDLCHLVYFFSGTGVMYLHGTRFSLDTPCFCLISAGDVHSFEVQDDIEGTIITASRAYLEKLLVGSEVCLQLLDDSRFIKGEEQPGYFNDIDPLFQKLRAEYTGRQPARGISIRSFLGLIFCQLARLEQGTSSTAKDLSLEDRNLWYYRQFQNLIGYSIVDKKPVSEYAAEIRISVTHLNRICQAVAGKSALKVIHDRVISEAKINLAYTFQSVSEVAYKLGFDDVAYFSRFFKSHTGVSPKAFKDSVRHQHQVSPDAGDE